MPEASLTLSQNAQKTTAHLTGDWVLASLNEPIFQVKKRLRALHAQNIEWDLLALERLDTAGAILLWHVWEKRFPAQIKISAAHQKIITEIAATIDKQAFSLANEEKKSAFSLIEKLGFTLFSVAKNARALLSLFGQIILDFAYLVRHPKEIPLHEISANIYKTGPLALPVIALVGFLIGIVLSFLSALQLKMLGADVLIVNLLGIGITRELGPIIVAVLVAGRSGSSMTAQIGVMRVTEEIDALATMGVSKSLRLIFPKIMALTLTMPLLILWCSAMGILGGMLAAKIELGLDFAVFIELLPKVVPIANLWIGIGKGVFFGFLIALIACHFGLKIKPNTESLSANTTSSVVTAIATVLLIDAVFAILTRGLGMPTL